MTGDEYYHQYAQHFPWYTGQGSGTTTTTTTDTGGIARLPITVPNQGGGDGGITDFSDYTQTWTQDLSKLQGVDPSQVTIQDIQDYGTYEPRTGILGAWDQTKNFLSGLGTSKVRGTLGDRLSKQPQIPLPAAMASWSMSPFNEKSRNWNPDFANQLNFLEMQDGMIGRDPRSGALKYGPESVLAGKNVISMFGSNNYAVALNKELARMQGLYAKHKKDSQKKKLERIELEIAALNEQKKKDQIEADKRAAALRAAQGRVDQSENIINRATEQNIQLNKNEGIGSVNPHSAYGKGKYTGGNPNPHTQSGWSGSYKKAQGGLIRSKKAVGGILGAF